jgi:phosphoglucosamine mutase
MALAFSLARSIKGRKGSVVVNVDTSAVVDYAVEAAGGRVIRSKVGDPYVLEAMIKHHAIAGGETCGAWIFPGISLCPDGVLSSIILLNLLEEGKMKPSEVRAGLPGLVLRRRKVQCPKLEKGSLMGRLEAEIRDRYGKEVILSVDGIRIGFSDKSWVLVRPSGTEPALRITAESTSEKKTLGLMDEFVKLIGAIRRGRI